MESSIVYERKSYQEEDVKYRETLEDVWEAGLQVHRLVIEDKQTSDISWRLTVGLTINVASTNYSKDWYDKNENALQDEADHALDTVVVALEIVLRKVPHSALFYLQRELFCLDPHNSGRDIKQVVMENIYLCICLLLLLFTRLQHFLHPPILNQNSWEERDTTNQNTGLPNLDVSMRTIPRS